MLPRSASQPCDNATGRIYRLCFCLCFQHKQYAPVRIRYRQHLPVYLAVLGRETMAGMHIEQQPYISKFIKLIMPDATERDQLDAQRDLDGFLDIIDRIERRIALEESGQRDKTAVSDTNTSITSERSNPSDTA